MMKLLKCILIIAGCCTNILTPAATATIAKKSPAPGSVTPKSKAPESTTHPTTAQSKTTQIPPVTHPAPKTPTPPVAPLAKPTPKINALSSPASNGDPAINKNAPKLNESIPYLQELQHAGMAQPICNAWAALYQQCQTAQNNTQPFAVTAQTEPLFNTDFFAMMAEHLDPKTFAPLTNDPLGTIHTSYATVHLRQAMQRYSDICKINIDPTSKQPSIHFTGDVRDLGILVNLQNNTDAQFAVYQKSIDGTQSTQIGLIQPGMNALDFYTAALQNNVTNTKNSAYPNNKNQSSNSATSNYFQLQELNAVSPVTIDLKIMTGTEVIAFLKTLYRDPQALKKDTFEMNGLPTSPEFITNPNDWYLLLIQNPTPSTATQRDPQQRIQAINITKFTAPYLLTLQINQENVEITPATHNNAAVYADVYQPSIQTALIPQNKTFKMDHVPLIILSDFLWKIPAMHALWMLQTTAHLSILTHAKFFDLKSFGDAFEYFNGIGCFDKENKYLFIIDKYNILKIGESFYDASWLLSSAIYETKLHAYSDVPKLYSGQDNYGHLVANITDAEHVNFQIILHPQKDITNVKEFFNKSDFNQIYSLSQYNLYTFFCAALKKELEESIFCTITEHINLNFNVILKNKKNTVLYTNQLSIHNPLDFIEITFIAQNAEWVGSSVPTQLLPNVNKQCIFKLTYDWNSSSNKSILLAAETSPIDKQEVILQQLFSIYPLKNLYLDVYSTYQVKPFTRCIIIENGTLPNPLSNLSEQDWIDGIYIIPFIKNNTHISINKPGKLSVAFYKSNKTFLGEITVTGSLNNQNNQTGIIEPAKAYDLYSSEFNPMHYLYLTTGVLLQYNKTL